MTAAAFASFSTKVATAAPRDRRFEPERPAAGEKVGDAQILE